MERAILNYCAKIARQALGGRCLLCDAPAREGTLCAGCLADLPRLPDSVCRVCAIPIAAGEICGSCLGKPPHFDRTLCPCAYAFPIDRMIQRFKYGGELALARPLAELMAATLRAERKPDVVIPMPLARDRLVARGFNQSVEIARLLGRTLQVEVDTEACVRVGHAPAQAALPWDERAKNVRGAFVCRAAVEGLDVAIVDDVLTTGATLSEIARVLKKRGANHVTGWIAARTLSPS